MERFEISCMRRHRAYDDAAVLWEFLQKLSNSISPEKMEKAFKMILKKPSLPPLLKNSDVENLPETPGVYMFFGKSEIPLYIGKSISIKDRVLSHFLNDTDSSTEMEISQQVERIETIETGGELSALILESELIKKMQPLYNRKLRNSRRLVVLRKTIIKDGYFSLSVGKGEEIKSEELGNILGIFKSQKSAKEHLARLVNEFGLCQKLLGLQKGSGPCFSYHLEKCKGACVGKENPMLFNARFIMAFSKTKMQSWPFNGPVIVKEKKDDVGEALVFDKWCYLGKYSEYAYEEKDGTTPLSDFDIYKILQSFLKDPKNLKKISTLNKIEEFSRMQNLI
jgi:DNA polymerase-3 subunit epsilon